MSHVLRSCPKCAAPSPAIWLVGLGTRWKRIECQCCRFTTARFRTVTGCALVWNNVSSISLIESLTPFFEIGERVKTITNLKACHCCSSQEPAIGLYGYKRSRYRVLCTFCGCSTGLWDRPDKATYFWNRADEKPNPSELQECGFGRIKSGGA